MHFFILGKYATNCATDNLGQAELRTMREMHQKDYKYQIMGKLCNISLFPWDSLKGIICNETPHNNTKKKKQHLNLQHSHTVCDKFAYLVNIHI